MAGSNWWEASLSNSTGPLMTSTGRYVPSEAISLNALTRSIIVRTPGCSTGLFGSTGYQLYRTPVALTVQRVTLTPVTSWAASTANGVSFTIWSCANGVLGTYTATSSSANPAGASFNLGTIASTAAQLASGAGLLGNLVATTCDGVAAHEIQVDFYTTG